MVTIMDKKLTARQKRFIEEYLVDFCATQAAIRAGYKKHSSTAIGHENLSKPYIQKELRYKFDRLAKEADLSAKWALERYKRIADSNIMDFLEKDDEGKIVVKDLEDLPRELTYAVKKIKRGQFGIELELESKMKSLNDIGRYLSMFVDAPPEESDTPRAINVSVKIIENEKREVKQIED